MPIQNKACHKKNLKVISHVYINTHLYRIAFYIYNICKCYNSTFKHIKIIFALRLVLFEILLQQIIKQKLFSTQNKYMVQNLVYHNRVINRPPHSLGIKHLIFVILVENLVPKFVSELNSIQLFQIHLTFRFMTALKVLSSTKTFLSI